MQALYFESLTHPYSEETNSFQSQIHYNNSYAAVQLFCTKQKQILQL